MKSPIGSPVTVTVNGGAAHAGEQIKLRITSDPASISNDDIQIAGVKESALKMADANGVVTFSVTLNAAGTYTVQAFNAAGALVGDQVLTVSAVGAAAGAELSDTGFDGMGLAVGAGALVLAGAGAVLVAKRRQSAHQPA